MQNVSQEEEEGGLNLIDARNRIEALKIKDIIQADRKLPEMDNITYEIGTHQQIICKHRLKSGNTSSYIQALVRNITEIGKYKYKCVKLETIQEIMFPLEKR